jgi:hypothetical protein
VSSPAIHGVYTVGSTIPVPVPSGVASLTIITQGTQGITPNVEFSFAGQSFTVPNGIVPSPIAGPAGSGIFFDDLDAGPNPPIPELSYVYYAPTSSQAAAVTLPNTTAMLGAVSAASGIPPGTWKLGVHDYAFECAQSGAICLDGGSTSHQYDVTVILKPGPPQLNGTLNLGVYLVSSSGLPSAAQAVSDPNIARFLKNLEALYSAAGICLGKVTFYDVPAWAKSRYGTVSADNATDPCSDLHQMFVLSQPGNTLNLFFVDAITSTAQPGYTVLGVDGTIPGLATVGGTVQSGAVVTASLLTDSVGCPGSFTPGPSASCGPDIVSYVSAHEGGHFMGLYHTTEGTGDVFDPLLDTPICDCAICAPASAGACASNNPASSTPYMLQGAECLTGLAYCGGGDALMFWLLNNGSKGTLTPEQAAVMRGSPAVN